MSTPNDAQLESQMASGAVTSVNGQTGVVVLDAADVGAPADSAVVHDTGAEAIAGVKTFVSPPVVPTPVGATDAANRGYVDDAVAAGGGGGATVITTVALGSGATYYSNIIVGAFTVEADSTSDVAGTLSLVESSDAGLAVGSWTTVVSDASGGTPQVASIGPASPALLYSRVKYVNGGTAQANLTITRTVTT